MQIIFIHIFHLFSFLHLKRYSKLRSPVAWTWTKVHLLDDMSLNSMYRSQLLRLHTMHRLRIVAILYAVPLWYALGPLLYDTIHRKKSFSIFPASPAGMSLTNLSLGGNNLYMTSLFPPRESSVGDIPAGDGNIEKFFYGERFPPPALCIPCIPHMSSLLVIYSILYFLSIKKGC
jgi:hypothetical protein